MKVVVAKNQKEVLDNSYVRGLVFIEEQGIDWAIEFDGLDPQCVLFTAYINDIAVGAARLFGNKVGRVATLKEYRGQGVASEMMKRIEEYSKENGIQKLKLHAQLYIKEWYEHLGYIAEGDIFQEAEIDHIKMTKEII
jgi:predicted GNAT family N-acyltransferase